MMDGPAQEPTKQKEQQSVSVMSQLIDIEH